MKKTAKIKGKLNEHETLRYLFFGMLTTLIGFGLYEAFYFLGFSAVASNSFSTVAAVLFAFITNKIWVFQSLNFSASALIQELVKFAMGRLVTFLLETAVLYVFVDYLKYDKTILKLITTVLVIVSNYAISKKIVFTKK